VSPNTVNEPLPLLNHHTSKQNEILNQKHIGQ